MEMSDITALASLLRQHGDKILGCSHQLTLTATMLWRLNEAFSMIVEPESGGTSFQVLSSNTSSAKLQDLHFLYDFVQKVEGLVISHGNSTLKGKVVITVFRNLRQLELRCIPLHMVSGLSQLRPRLRCITASRALGRPADLLEENGQPEDLLPSWPELRRLSLPHNTLSSVDMSLRLATGLKELDLRHNQLCDTKCLELLPGLVALDLSYNRLQRIPVLHKQASRTLKALSLTHNQLENLNGLELLTSLRTLQLSWNCLVELATLTPLSRLPALKQLWLVGNPLSRHNKYRERAARRLHPSTTLFILDGRRLSEQEMRCVGATAVCLLTTCPQTEGEGTIDEARGRERRGAKVREVVISDIEEDLDNSLLVQSTVSLGPNCGSLETSIEHLETKRQIENLREQLGDAWLGCVPNVLGLQNSVADQNVSGSFQRHEAQAWLDSQERPSRINGSLISQASPMPSLQSSSPAHLPSSNQQLQQPEVNMQQFPEVNTDSGLTEDSDPGLTGISNLGNDNVESLEWEDEEDEEGSEAPYLVQSEVTTARGDTLTKDLFLIVGPSNLSEREASGRGRILAKWTMDSLQSCERPIPNRVSLTFDTVKRDKQKRDYLLEAIDAQRLYRCLSGRLEARSLRDMNQMVFRCMRCSGHFSVEMAGDEGKVARCPSCQSAVVVQIEEGEVQSVPPLHHSASHSSIGDNTSPAASISKVVVVAAEVHQHTTSNTSSPPPSNKSSAASLEQSMSDSGLGLHGGMKNSGGADSDIEVLSNPSQSSIEVLPPSEETHSREQSLAPSSEARVEAGPPTKASLGLTESSSSGSMTDSVCTAYESALSPVSHLGSAPPSSLGSVLGGFLQRLAPSPSTLQVPLPPQAATILQPVLYSFSDFSRVDHRLKLYLCMKELNRDNELLTALLRSWILPANTTTGLPFPGLLVLSSQALYIMKITGLEGDNPESWLVREGSWPISQLSSLNLTCWQHGVSVSLTTSASKNGAAYLCLLGDTRHAPAFLAHVRGLVPATCTIRRPQEEVTDEEGDKTTTQGGDGETFLLAAHFQIVLDTGVPSAPVGPSALVLSDTEIAVAGEDLRWLVVDPAPISPTSAPNWLAKHGISNLTEVELSATAPWRLTLRFLEEVEGGREEEWRLCFTTVKARLAAYEALKKPWEALFSIPLQPTTL